MKDLEIIPDFFYELISRIIPGFVTIAICLYHPCSHFDISKLNFELFCLMLLGAWIIGVTLDIGVFVLIKHLATRCAWIDKKVKDVPELDLKSDCGMNDYLCDTEPWQRNGYNKATALAIFFRSMACICVFVVLMTLCVFTVMIIHSMAILAFNLECLLSVGMLTQLFLYSIVYGIAGVFLSFVFYKCWNAQKGAVKAWGEAIEKSVRKKTDHSKDHG